MKQFKNFLAVALFVTSLFSIWFPYSSWYPFGYPIQKGDIWKITWVYNKGTPIQRNEVIIVEIDSTFQGYVVKAHIKGTNQEYTSGSDMRAFLGTWGHSWPYRSELINR